jgi:hypothetical protein
MFGSANMAMNRSFSPMMGGGGGGGGNSNRRHKRAALASMPQAPRITAQAMSDEVDNVDWDSGTSTSSAAPGDDKGGKLHAVVAAQSFNGSFPLDEAFSKAIGRTLDQIQKGKISSIFTVCFNQKL